MAEVRLQKALADAGVASRRAAEALIASGRVRVNGHPATLGLRVDPALDRIEVDGRGLPAPMRHVHLALNKPAAVTSTVSDRHADRTVLDLVDRDLRRRAGRLYPVGRLDRDSEGLLLLTNDGLWAERVLHPRYGVDREYAVGVGRPLTPRDAVALREGISMEEGTARVVSLRLATGAEIRSMAEWVHGDTRGLHWYRVVLRQGWRRQLRRMFAAVGVPVERLVRVRIGPVWLRGLPPAAVRPLEGREVARLGAWGGDEPGVSPDAPPRDTPRHAAVRRDAPLRDAARSDAPRPDGAGGRPRPGSRRRGLVVSLDGPGSSGKSTVGSAAAERLGYRFCDTGLLYRALTWLGLESGVDPEDADALVRLAPAVGLEADDAGRFVRVVHQGRDVTDHVRSPAVDRSVSAVSRHQAVRETLLDRQRGLVGDGGIIMAGRDIGTQVLPDADLKLWLEVSPGERARRRAAERGITDAAAVGRLAEDLRVRDEQDSRRRVSPLRRPAGAVVIESDGNTFEQTVEEVVRVVRDRERQEGDERGGG